MPQTRLNERKHASGFCACSNNKVRKKYSMVKRHRRVRLLPAIAGKQNPCQSTHTIARVEVPASNVDRCGIEIQMSPLKKQRVKKSSAPMSDASSGVEKTRA